MTPELVILAGLPGAGKTSFYRDRLAATHVHVSGDLLRNRRDPRAREMALVDEALAAGRSVAVDDVNATRANRAALVAAARRHGTTVTCYVLTTAAAECLARNRARTERVPAVAIRVAANRWEPPTAAEGFDAVHQVVAENGRFDVVVPPSVFLLSPASTTGERAASLLSPRADFPLARALRSEAGAPLGDVFAFLSSLYFRGKLTYARAFARPPAGLCGAFVVTPGEGLRDPAEPITLVRLRRYADVPIRTSEPRYLGPLVRDAEALAALAGDACRIVLLGSVASPRYVEPLMGVFGERLLFPRTFVGRGDMSRGGLLLRAVADGRELAYAPLAGAVRHGPRPARLPRRPRPSALTGRT